ncbi:hypothetical protein IKN40_00920 [bacterium]|nr:hypothetical protein [bacterium]
MRKNKGYQKDIKRTWHKKERINSYAKGHNETLEQYIAYINECFDERIETCKRQYEKISTKTTLEGKDLYKYCREYSMWEIKFNIDYDKDKYTLIPLEKALEMIEEDRRKTLGIRLYSNCGAYQKRIIHKDNQKFVYNSNNGGSNRNTIRIPSLKRSNSTWKKFYELFPKLNGMKMYRGIKLKKIK